MKKKTVQGNVSTKSTDSLLFKFAIIFTIFTVVTIIFCGVATYILQTRIYKEQVENKVRNIADYLQVLIKADGNEFIDYQSYLLEHKDEILIPFDYDGNYLPAKEKFEELFARQYPGKTLWEDISFNELSEEVKNAYVVYTHEYWLYVFESATEAFDVKYTYYILPAQEPSHMYYIIDPIREENLVGGKSYISLALNSYEDSEKYPVMWETLEKEVALHSYDIFDNQYGYNYAFYSPLFIGGQKQGLICVEVEIQKVNKEILKNSIFLTLGIGFILAIGVVILLIFIEKRYISKLEKLVSSVQQYTKSKDPDIAEFIEYDISTKDEIASLANQTAAMILELDSYMKNLVNTTRELSDTKQQAKDLQALSNRDALTGIRNKNAYDEELKRLEWDVVDGSVGFGFAIIDLNFLKKINDEYGIDKGNIAIKKLCLLACNTFKHSPVFRIGGDEFVVILKNRDYDNVDELVMQFNKEIDRIDNDTSLEPWEKISAAIGIALFDPERDHSVNDVFKRADANMFEKKHAMKASKEI